MSPIAGARIAERRPAGRSLLLVVALLAGACTPAWPASPSVGAAREVVIATPAPIGQRPTAYDPPLAARALVLTDTRGARFDLATLRGEPVIVEFGYTHCPDVCPTTLADVRDAIRIAGGPVGVVFVTVDPERDDGPTLGRYLNSFRSGFVGLTGTPAEIRAVADAWGVAYQRLPSESTSGYAMAHTADIFLVDAAGTLRHHIFFGAGSRLIAERIEAVRAEAP